MKRSYIPTDSQILQEPPKKKQKRKRKKKKKKKEIIYEYGNYYHYYGYRTPDYNDPHIGCNAGNVTTWIAANFSPWRIIGIDIDSKLIGRARNRLNSKHLFKFIEKKEDEVNNDTKQDLLSNNKQDNNEIIKDNDNIQTCYKFPDNIQFKTMNFIEENTLDWQRFDVILCLSVSKWIHLNWGDEGIMKLFKKVYSILEVNGKFIFEPQPWTSYKKKYNITNTTETNFKQIKIKPDEFKDILVNEIGFKTCEEININYPESFPDGFSKRPLYLFTK